MGQRKPQDHNSFAKPTPTNVATNCLKDLLPSVFPTIFPYAISEMPLFKLLINLWFSCIMTWNAQTMSSWKHTLRYETNFWIEDLNYICEGKWKRDENSVSSWHAQTSSSPLCNGSFVIPYNTQCHPPYETLFRALIAIGTL